MIAAMEKPLATRTLIAVTIEASRNAIIVVIDSSLYFPASPLRNSMLSSSSLVLNALSSL